jgi:hypothetical protein
MFLSETAGRFFGGAAWMNASGAHRIRQVKKQDSRGSGDWQRFMFGRAQKLKNERVGNSLSGLSSDSSSMQHPGAKVKSSPVQQLISGAEVRYDKNQI